MLMWLCKIQISKSELRSLEEKMMVRQAKKAALLSMPDSQTLIEAEAAEIPVSI